MILYLPEQPEVPIIDLVTPESSVIYVSPPSSIFSELLDSDGESVCDPIMLDELDYHFSCASSSFSGSFVAYSPSMSMCSVFSLNSSFSESAPSPAESEDASVSIVSESSGSDCVYSEHSGSPLYLFKEDQ